MPPFSPDDRPDHHNGRHYDDRNNSINDNDTNTTTTTSSSSSSIENSEPGENLIKSAAIAISIDEKVLSGRPKEGGSTNDPYIAFGHSTTNRALEEEFHDCFEFEDGGHGDDRDECDFGDDDYHHTSAVHSYSNTPEQHHGLCFRQSLPTIFERKVVFAGTWVAGGAFVSDAITVVPIAPRSEYTRDEKRRLWYTPGELANLRRSAVNTALRVSRNPRDRVLYKQCPLQYRGLEHLIDHAIRDTDDEEDDGAPRTAESRRWNAVQAVLDEQDRLRFYCYQQYYYYANVNYGSGMVCCDVVGADIDERLRSVYTYLGETEQSSAIAHRKAALDESHARELWREDDDHHHQTHESHNGNDGYYYQYHKNENTGGLLLGEQRLTPSNGARVVLQKLLVPVLRSFLEIREGNIYIDTGELCCD